MQYTNIFHLEYIASNQTITNNNNIKSEKNDFVAGKRKKFWQCTVCIYIENGGHSSDYVNFEIHSILYLYLNLCVFSHNSCHEGAQKRSDKNTVIFQLY